MSGAGCRAGEAARQPSSATAFAPDVLTGVERLQEFNQREPDAPRILEALDVGTDSSSCKLPFGHCAGARDR